MTQKRPRRSSIFWTLLLLISAAVVGGATWLVWSTVRPASVVDHDVLRLKWEYPVVLYHPGKAAVQTKRGKQAATKSSFSISIQKTRPPLWVSERDVSHVAKWAIIVSEDWAFYQHDGFDSAQIEEAIKKDVREGRMARGASTITQQVAKNIFLSGEKSLIRKAREFSLAIQMDRALSKSRILELYLNIAEWGEGIFGIRAAANHYFQKEPSELTAREGAYLAMLLPSPKRYSQGFRDGELTDFNRRVMRSILGKLVQAKILTEEEQAEANAQRLSFERTLAPEAAVDFITDGPSHEESPTEVDQTALVE